MLSIAIFTSFCNLDILLSTVLCYLPQFPRTLQREREINMVQKCLLGLVVLFVVCSHVLSSVAVPATRSLKSNEEKPPPVQDFLLQDEADLSDGDGLIDVEEGFIEGRMDMESTDYPGTGANNHHDPRTPGRA